VGNGFQKARFVNKQGCVRDRSENPFFVAHSEVEGQQKKIGTNSPPERPKKHNFIN